jgi:xylose isomerase
VLTKAVVMCFAFFFCCHAADIFGSPTIKRSFDDESPSMENAKRRMRAAFEMMSKLGVRYWTFHDRDIGQCLSGARALATPATTTRAERVVR